MTDSHESTITVGCVEDGYLLRVRGSGTNRESIAVDQFLEGSIAEDPAHPVAVYIDLSQCDYLDSTFMGCMLGLHKHACRKELARFALIAPSDECRKLLSHNRLDQIFLIVSDPPAVKGEEVNLPIGYVDSKDFGVHVMECHRRLAGVEGPNQRLFAKIAEQISKEMGSRTTTPS